MTAIRVERPAPLVRLAVAGDEDEARRWLDALTRAEIDAELRIEEAARLAAGSSVFPTGPAFATALYVAASRRADAAAVLIDVGWQGRLMPRPRHTIDPTVAVVGAVVTALVGVGMAVVLAMRAS